MSDVVSIVMPAKNAGGFIKQSIDSILAQTYHQFELIVIDDQSTDNTRDIVSNYSDPRVIVVDGPGAGISAALNVGLEHAKGEYFCRCDSDDLFPQHRLKIQAEWLDKHPEYIAVCGSYSSIDSKGRHIIQYHKNTRSRCIDSHFMDGQVITHFGTFMVKTSALRAIGGCRTFFETAEDIDLQLRLSQQGAIFFIADNFYQYRLHHFSITHNQLNSRRIFFEDYAKQCHLQRLEVGKDDLMMGRKPEIPDSIELETKTADEHITNQLISESWYWFNTGDYKQAFKSGFRLVSMSPLKWLSWRNYMLLIFKRLKQTVY
nr:glycosyltransferase family A protein [uncultured Methylophaga sp.]